MRLPRAGMALNCNLPCSLGKRPSDQQFSPAPFKHLPYSSASAITRHAISDRFRGR